MSRLEQRGHNLDLRYLHHRRLGAGQPRKLLPVAGTDTNAVRGTRLDRGNGNSLSQ
jgi:hypothetical protein